MTSLFAMQTLDTTTLVELELHANAEKESNAIPHAQWPVKLETETLMLLTFVNQD